MTIPKSQRSDDRHLWWYRRLLLCYPGWFRRAYRTQMEADFTDLLAAYRTRIGPARAWWIALTDVVRSAPSEWMRRQAGLGNGPNRPANSRRQRVGEIMTTLFQDIRVATRTFRRSPGFAALVVVTLAVGIGGTIAMFSVADGVLFTELPYRDSNRMAVIWNRHATTGSDNVLVSGAS